MTIQDRLRLAQAAGTEYAELADTFEAALTQDEQALANFAKHSSAAVRFAALCNPKWVITDSELANNPLAKYAAVFNPSTSSALLDQIGMIQPTKNPVIPEAIHAHKNASKEFQVFRAINDIGLNEDNYEDESEMYFYEAIFDDGDVQGMIDLESLEALFYLYILGFIDAPSPTREFWEYFLDSEPKNLSENLHLFGSLPAIPEDLYDECEAVVGARCLAGAWTHDVSLMRSLAWDKQLLYTGVGGFYWQDSRSPRSSVASNHKAPVDLLRMLYAEELADTEGLNAFPHPVFWRLACNPSSPHDVLEGIISLIEESKITEEYARRELLVGEDGDYPYGLITNPAVQGDLRARVEKLVIERNLDPNDFEILQTD